MPASLEDLREAYRDALQRARELEVAIQQKESEVSVSAAAESNARWREAVGELDTGWKHSFIGLHRLDFWGHGEKRVAAWLNYGSFNPAFRNLIKRLLVRPGNRQAWVKYVRGWTVSLPDGWRNRPAVGPKGINYVKFSHPARHWRVILYIDQGLPEPLYRVLVAGTADPEKEYEDEGSQEVPVRATG